MCYVRSQQIHKTSIDVAYKVHNEAWTKWNKEMCSSSRLTRVECPGWSNTGYKPARKRKQRMSRMTNFGPDGKKFRQKSYGLCSIGELCILTTKPTPFRLKFYAKSEVMYYKRFNCIIMHISGPSQTSPKSMHYVHYEMVKFWLPIFSLESLCIMTSYCTASN